MTLGGIIKKAQTIKLGSDRELPILSMTMHHGLVDQSEKFKKRIASVDLSPYKVVKQGQLVVGFPIDEAVLSVQELYSEAIVSPAYAIWDVDEKIAHPPYIEMFLRSPAAIVFYKAHLQGSTARRRSLPDSVFLSMDVLLPPLPEQRRIAAILDQAAALINNRLDAKKELADLEQHYTNSIPAESCSTLGDLVTEFRYGTSIKSGPTGVAVLRIPNISSRSLNLTDIKLVELEPSELARLTLNVNDLLIVRSNGNRSIVGATVEMPKTIVDDQIVFASYLIRARLKQPSAASYVARYLGSSKGHAAMGAGATTSAGQFNINTKTLAQIPIPIPSASSIRKFNENVLLFENLRLKQEAHLTKLREMYSVLQFRAFRGEL